ncbi:MULTISPECIES: hypothetical protein [Sphingomonadales]|uniref:hypothetical protein n=1 Tax=Sphingomonadales TaxID=204457 RepID=UPI000826EBA7|nr:MULTISPECIES: hypothetical protein [Sphingomonadales]
MLTAREHNENKGACRVADSPSSPNDPDRIEQLSHQAEGSSVAWIIIRALQGYDYPKERGIINVTLMDQLPKRDCPPRET